MTTMITGDLYTIGHTFIYDSAEKLEKDLCDYRTQHWQNESNYIPTEAIVVFLRICTFIIPFGPWHKIMVGRQQKVLTKRKKIKYAKVILGDKIKYVKLDCLKKYNKK